MEPIYCPKCKALMAESVAFCPRCGAATNLAAKKAKEAFLGVTTPPPVQEKNKHAGIILFCVIAAGFAFSVTLQVREAQKPQPAGQEARKVAKAPAPTPPPVAPAYTPPSAPAYVPPTQSAEETRQRIEIIGNAIADNGGRMTVNESTVRIYLPGPVSEYDALRVAKMAGDRIGVGYTVRVYDNADLQRAQYTMW